MEAEAELQEEEEKALAALRTKRKERLSVVEEKKAALRGRLEKTYVQQQVKLAEEHLEKEREKMSLVQKTFGFFGKKSRVGLSVRHYCHPYSSIPIHIHIHQGNVFHVYVNNPTIKCVSISILQRWASFQAVASHSSPLCVPSTSALGANQLF